MLKGTQRRLLDAANTLGLSRDVIGWIERRRYVALAPYSTDSLYSDWWCSFVSEQYAGYVDIHRRRDLHLLLFLGDLALLGMSVVTM